MIEFIDLMTLEQFIYFCQKNVAMSFCKVLSVICKICKYYISNISLLKSCLMEVLCRLSLQIPRGILKEIYLVSEDQEFLLYFSLILFVEFFLKDLATILSSFF